jgi:secreted trypsin-like serine protease
MSDTLQRADLPILPYEKCFQTGNDATFWNRLIPGENFCAGYKNGTSTCQGDSGGGIAFKVNGRWFLRGIVSFGPVRKGTDFAIQTITAFFWTLLTTWSGSRKALNQQKFIPRH